MAMDQTISDDGDKDWAKKWNMPDTDVIHSCSECWAEVTEWYRRSDFVILISGSNFGMHGAVPTNV